MSRKGLWKRTFRLGHCLGGKPAGILIKSLLWRTSLRKTTTPYASKDISTSSWFNAANVSFSHLNATNNSPKMVDVTHKVPMRRKAHAQCKVMLPSIGNTNNSSSNILPSITFTNSFFHPAVLEKLREYSKIKDTSSSRHGTKEAYEWRSAKGSIIATAVIAGVMAAKKTSDLIPLCHSIPLEGCDINIDLINEVSCLRTLYYNSNNFTFRHAL